MRILSEGHLTAPREPGHTEGYTVLADLDEDGIAKIRKYRDAFLAAKEISPNLMFMTFPCVCDARFFDERDGEHVFDEDELDDAFDGKNHVIDTSEDGFDLEPFGDSDQQMGVVHDENKTIVVNGTEFWFVGHGTDDGYGDGRVANIRSVGIDYTEIGL